MNELKQSDSADEQMRKMLENINILTQLTSQLIEVGKELNVAKGKYQEVKAKIRLRKEIINGLKVTIRAEANAV